MKILVITNLCPPHDGGSLDHQCAEVVKSLETRGHSIFILTSSHGLSAGYREEKIHRSLALNGFADHPRVTGFQEMRAMELANNEAVTDALAQFEPELVYVFSLMGVSKSIIFTLRNSKLPVVYNVFDHWLSANVREDPWLHFWNAPSLPFLQQSARAAMELSGERGRLDHSAPTRMSRGYDRAPGLFGDGKKRAAVEPNSIAGFRFDRIYFCSEALKKLTEQTGFCVQHAEVIYPGITTSYVGELQPMGAPMTKFLMVGRLDEHCGAMTVLKAMELLRGAGLKATLSICGRGESGYLASLRSFVISHQLPVEFISVGNQSAELPAIYKRHHVFLHPPEWAEPFPFAPLEAMGCGLPVIGSTAGGAQELLRHGENSLTFAPGDFTELARRVQELLISPALRYQMAENAQADVLTRFNESAVIDKVENFLVTSQAQTT